MTARHQGEQLGADDAAHGAAAGRGAWPAAALVDRARHPRDGRRTPRPVLRHWLRHPVTTAEEAHRIIRASRADRRAGTGFSFAVLVVNADGTTGDLVGSVSIRGLAIETASGEVGYWVTAPSRGQGSRRGH